VCFKIEQYYGAKLDNVSERCLLRVLSSMLVLLMCCSSDLHSPRGDMRVMSFEDEKLLPGSTEYVGDNILASRHLVLQQV